MQFTRNRTLADLIEKQKQLDEGKQDFRVSSKKLGVNVAHERLGIVLPTDEPTCLFPTDHALRQFTQAHSLDMKTWRRVEEQECPDDVTEHFSRFVDATLGSMWGLKTTDPEKLVRTQGSKLRAYMSADYGVFNNAKALELTQKAADVLDNSGLDLRVWDAYQTEDELCVRLIAPEHGKDEPGGSSPVYPGVYIGNSEIGTKKIYVQPLVLRQVCSNGMMGVREEGAGMSRVHRGSVMILENDFNMAVADALNLSNAQVERFLGLTEQTVQDPLKELARIWSKHQKRSEFTADKLSTAEGMARTLMEQFGNTKYTVVNAMTELAHSYEDVNSRLIVEELAGQYALAGVGTSEQ